MIAMLVNLRMASGRKGELHYISQSVGGCACWCQEWFEMMARRPSGVTSWVARVPSGLFSNRPSRETDLTFADMRDLLKLRLWKGHCTEEQLQPQYWWRGWSGKQH